MTSISINKKTTRFFIAIGKQRTHSFVMLGIYNENKVSQLLCRVGKGNDIADKKKRPTTLEAGKNVLNCIFFETKANLYSENVRENQEHKREISYHAYDVSYENYIEFIKILEGIQTNKNKFKCFKPNKKIGDDEVEMVLKDSLIFGINQQPELQQSTCTISIDNTCRHTAIELVEKAQGRPISPMVSSNFFVNLPNKTELTYGKPAETIPFYVLPIPPAAFPKLPKEKKHILEKMYSQMERMLLTEPNSKQTQSKFNCIKDFYSQMLGPMNDVTLEQLLSSIQNWKKVNSTTLSVLRKTYFWDSWITRTSATNKMIAAIEKDLQEHLGNFPVLEEKGKMKEIRAC